MGVLGVGQDITEKVHAEKAQSAIATELLILIDTANAPIFGVDTNLLITEWNQKAVEITQYSKEEVLGKPLVDTYITAEYKEPVRSVLTAAANGGQQAASYEFPLYTKTGERVELLLNATTRRDADGEIMGVLGVGQDITEKVRAEKAQSAIATELLTLIDSANAPIFGVDTDLLISEWNQKAVQITGYSKEEVLGKPLVDTYITPEYKDPVRSVLTAAATGGEEAASYEFPLYTKTGERVELLLNATTRRDADGEIMGVLGVGQDITEKVHAEKAQSAIATELLTLIDTANAPIF